MSFDVAPAVISLIGVALGGALSFVAQRLTVRANERLEDRRQGVVRVEARRSEQISMIDKFMAAAQAVERVAIDIRHENMEDDEVRRRGDFAVDDLWLAEKLVRIVCSRDFERAAFDYTWKLDNSVHRGIEDSPDIWAFLLPTREAFLNAANAELDQLGGLTRMG